jgi:hypothetical protein
MRQWHSERGNVLLMSVIVILDITDIGLAVVRYSSREVSAAIAGRKEAAVTACAEAARSLLMSQWKLLSAHGTSVAPLNVTLDTASQTQIQGGHYGQNPSGSGFWNATAQIWVNNVQVIKLDPLTVGPSYQVNDLTNRIGDTVQAYRVVAHCTQGGGRQVEVEFGVQYGL